MRDNPGARWFAAMLAGDFAAAHAVSAAVLAGRDLATRDDPALPYHLRWVWDGTPLDGADVLVRCYHGLGDVLHFARFVPEAARRARSLALEAPPALLPLLTELGADALIPFDVARPAPPRACTIEIMELFFALGRPALLRNARLSFPPPALREGLGVGLPPPTPLPSIPPAHLPHGTIGLCWQAGDWDAARSVPLADLLAALPPDRPLVSLQRGPAAADAADARFLNPRDADTDPVLTAALIQGAAMVVTVDTMVAHLAGTLGAPTHLLLRREADWRWMRGRDDCPWYRSMRLYRQEREGDWAAPLSRIGALTSPPAG